MKIHSAVTLAACVLLSLLFGLSHSVAVPATCLSPEIPICTNAGDQIAPVAVSDGCGGVIIAWQDHRGSVPTIYAQRVSALGERLWTEGGVRVGYDSTIQIAPRIVSDMAGGAIIEWEDDGVVPVVGPPGGPFLAEYVRGFSAQRIDREGNLLWGPQGAIILMVNATYDPYAYNRDSKLVTGIAADGVGGAFFLTYEFYGLSSHSYADLMLGRIGGSGVVLWSNVGVAGSIETLPFSHGRIIADGLEGAIVSWTYATEGFGSEMISNKLGSARYDGTGNILWSASPILDPSQQAVFSHDMCPDGSGGVYFCWDAATSYPASTNAERQIFAQRIDDGGAVRWGASGVTLCNAPGLQTNPTIAPSPAGGAIAAWQDFRMNATVGDLYAARTNSSGDILWANNGVEVCHADTTSTIRGIICDSVGGAVIVWEGGPVLDRGIFAQSLCPSGTFQWPVNGVPVTLNHGDPLNSVVAANAVLRPLAVWQDRKSSMDFNIDAQWADANVEPLPAGSVRVTVMTNPPGRSFIVDDTVYTVSRTFVWATGSKHAIGVEGQQPIQAGMRYSWNHWSDGDSAMHVVTVPANSMMYMASFDLTCLLTVSAGPGGTVMPPGGWYRKGDTVRIVARPTEGWKVDQWTGVGSGSYSGNDTAAMLIIDSALTEIVTFQPATAVASSNNGMPTTFGLNGNYPNPFNPATVVSAQWPVTSVVRLVVYDALGREVSVLANGEYPAGYYEFRFDASRFSSGVYFCRLVAGKNVFVKKMTLLK